MKSVNLYEAVVSDFEALACACGDAEASPVRETLIEKDRDSKVVMIIDPSVNDFDSATGRWRLEQLRLVSCEISPDFFEVIGRDVQVNRVDIEECKSTTDVRISGPSKIRDVRQVAILRSDVMNTELDIVVRMPSLRRLVLSEGAVPPSTLAEWK
jgi:hypothetical protein